MLRIAFMLLAIMTIPAQAADSQLHDQLERVAARRIYFAHQSVGANIIAGLKELARSEDVALPRFSDSFVEENGAPLKKLQNFRAELAHRPGVDVAILKFCYVDITADTDVRGLFEEYRDAVEELRAKYPRTTFVHVTLPLTDVQGGVKAFAKRLLGRHPYGTVENLRREEYNALLRKAYAGREPLFDLARLESTDPAGHVVTVAWDGEAAPALASAYTDDGGHLNETGRVRAARELVRVLAALP